MKQNAPIDHNGLEVKEAPVIVMDYPYIFSILNFTLPSDDYLIYQSLFLILSLKSFFPSSESIAKLINLLSWLGVRWHSIFT